MDHQKQQLMNVVCWAMDIFQCNFSPETFVKNRFEKCWSTVCCWLNYSEQNKPTNTSLLFLIEWYISGVNYTVMSITVFFCYTPETNPERLSFFPVINQHPNFYPSQGSSSKWHFFRWWKTELAWFVTVLGGLF